MTQESWENSQFTFQAIVMGAGILGAIVVLIVAITGIFSDGGYTRQRVCSDRIDLYRNDRDGQYCLMRQYEDVHGIDGDTWTSVRREPVECFGQNEARAYKRCKGLSGR